VATNSIEPRLGHPSLPPSLPPSLLSPLPPTTSGGYTTSNKITSLSPHIETLILWGKEDKILEPKLYAEKFIEDLGTTRAQLKFIEECGHVCHLEKPLLAAEEIVQFVKGGREGGGGWVQAIGPAYGEERREGEKEGRGWLAEMMASFRSTGGEGGKDGGEEGRREEPCGTCHDEEVVDCSNCDGIGSYTTYGRTVQCNGTCSAACPPSFPPPLPSSFPYSTPPFLPPQSAKAQG